MLQTCYFVFLIESSIYVPPQFCEMEKISPRNIQINSLSFFLATHFHSIYHYLVPLEITARHRLCVVPIPRRT